jgi:hypothetical protein
MPSNAALRNISINPPKNAKSPFNLEECKKKLKPWLDLKMRSSPMMDTI